MPTPTLSPNLIGALSALAAAFFFSVNDTAIKFMSGGYALHEVVLIRSVGAMVVFLLLIMPFAGGWRVIKTKRLGMHLLRGSCVVFANMAFFLGLAAMPLAEAMAIFFVNPVIITVFSVVFLAEKVGPWRWGAVGIGLIGVIVMIRPGSDAFQTAALLPLISAAAYAFLHVLTRKIGGTESAATMLFYIQLTFIVASLAFGLVLGSGQYAGTGNASLEFLFRAWIWPEFGDWWILILIGVTSAAGGFLISQAYRSSEAAFVAPFEYAALLLAILWGVLIFGEWPDFTAWLGIALIISSGLVLLWREALGKGLLSRRSPRLRR